MPAVDILGVAKMYPSDGLCQCLGTPRRGNEVNMVGHQAEAEDRHIRGGRFLGQHIQVGAAIHIAEKDILTVISALGNVMGDFGDNNASGSRHKA